MSDYKDVFLKSSEAYQARDIDKALSFVSDDYTYYRITEDGPKVLATGKEEVRRNLGAIFNNPSYKKGKAVYTESFGHMVIALEKDTFENDGKEITVSNFGVYEYKDGKLFRAWTFPVDESEVKVEL